MPRGRQPPIERALLERLFWLRRSPAAEVARQFGVSRQLTSRYLRQLADEQVIASVGSGRWTRYRLQHHKVYEETYATDSGTREDLAWKNASAALTNLSVDAIDICHHGITEMFNNALDHSASPTVRVLIRRTPVSLRIQIADRGIGIFQRIAQGFNLPDARAALLELSKGRTTTDPKRHTGEGVFFTSRIFDRYRIRSGDLLFYHRLEQDDWLYEDKENAVVGTLITMDLVIPTERDVPAIFKRYSSGPEDYSFSKTHVPIRLASFGDEALISRSAAKRVLSRVDRFAEVMLDFDGVRSVGQGFADEIFRVFANAHPATKLIGINMNAQVTSMVNRATSRRDEDDPTLF